MSDDRDKWGRPVKANSGRFEKGVSGNPKGRPPKRERALTSLQSESDMLAIFDEVVSVKIGGKVQKVTQSQLLKRSAMQRAIKGDARIMLQLMRLEEELHARRERRRPDEFKTLAETEKRVAEAGGEKEIDALGARLLNEMRKKTRIL